MSRQICFGFFGVEANIYREAALVSGGCRDSDSKHKFLFDRADSRTSIRICYSCYFFWALSMSIGETGEPAVSKSANPRKALDRMLSIIVIPRHSIVIQESEKSRAILAHSLLVRRCDRRRIVRRLN